MNSEALLTILLTLHPALAVRSPEARRATVERLGVIVDACRSVGLHGAACAPVVATCFVESGLRTRHTRAPLCGCQPYDTDDATQARCAARSWRTSLARCHTPLGAVTRYGYGLCRVPRGRRFRAARLQQSHRARLVLALTREIRRGTK